ncbi:MAG: hypothetical protein AAGC78_06390 [Cellvibrio sp.]|uniref:ACP phosphodiesterase n=1 Tax=Cellvibrio sp. TaxID=1965322 RepID=UPI0031A35404
MNWLAHAYLSKRNIEFRVGNILPDLVSITELKKFSPPCIDLRLRRPAGLANAIALLEQDYDLYEQEFTRFFAELQAYVRPFIIES